VKAAVHSGVIPLGNLAGFTFLPAMQLEVITELGITALPSRNGRHDGRRHSAIPVPLRTPKHRSAAEASR
jgi:hypothetical protein